MKTSKFTDSQILSILKQNEVTYHNENPGTPSIPSYVGNDTPASAHEIANGFTPLLQGTLDSLTDIDHYILGAGFIHATSQC